MTQAVLAATKIEPAKLISKLRQQQKGKQQYERIQKRMQTLSLKRVELNY